MPTNRASMPDTFITRPHATHARLTAEPDPNWSDAPRRTIMVVSGFVVALVSLAVGSIALAQIWFPTSYDLATGSEPFLFRGEALAGVILGGLGLAAGASLIGIGMGHWTAPRPPTSEADYTGPGHLDDLQDPPRVV
jgi:hypothetical protein